jgi:hypothetical protein
VEDLSTVHTTRSSIEAHNSSTSTIMLDEHHRLRPVHYRQTRKPGRRGIIYNVFILGHGRREATHPKYKTLWTFILKGLVAMIGIKAIALGLGNS